MKERPILMSAPMVRALLDGSKTQTRRVVKPEAAHTLFQFRGDTAADGSDEPTGEWAWCGSERVVNKHIRCPYGVPGDQLYVRETWAAPHAYDALPPRLISAPTRFHYAADEERGGLLWRPSIHMPRWASRITLEVTDVRVERLQDISEADAIAEGIATSPSLANPGADVFFDYHVPNDPAEWFGNPVDSYRSLWESINGAGSWETNPWVWVVGFARGAQ